MQYIDISLDFAAQLQNEMTILHFLSPSDNHVESVYTFKPFFFHFRSNCSQLSRTLFSASILVRIGLSSFFQFLHWLVCVSILIALFWHSLIVSAALVSLSCANLRPAHPFVVISESSPGHARASFTFLFKSLG